MDVHWGPEVIFVLAQAFAVLKGSREVKPVHSRLLRSLAQDILDAANQALWVS